MENQNKEFYRVVSTATGLLEEMEMVDKIIKGEDPHRVEYNFNNK